MPGQRSRALGFTLVELMVTITVAAVLLVVAVPNFVTIINSNRLASAANEMMAMVQTARMEAIRSNRRTILCPSPSPDNAAAPSCASAGATGWIVFRDDNLDGNPSAAELIRATTVPASVQMVTSTAIGSKVVFRADGLARDTGGTGGLLKGTVQFCIPTRKPEQNLRLVSVAGGSRVAIRQGVGNGACPTTVND